MNYIVRKNCFDGENQLVNSTTVYCSDNARDCLKYIEETTNPELYKLDSIPLTGYIPDKK
ncbi:MAG: hypothetical protein ACRCXX_07880 [Cetobacterium sp.]|uniref:hypothetical protein n=1 Tax=Cetobacterium sp. TaxID=2071632 RepID=UPI003F35FD5A